MEVDGEVRVMEARVDGVIMIPMPMEAMGVMATHTVEVMVMEVDGVLAMEVEPLVARCVAVPGVLQGTLFSY